jgi:hypothetical protein
MAQYVSGRQPFLNVGIPGITTNIPVMDITGRVGIGTTNPSADLDLSTIRIRQSISDVNNFTGGLGYFLTKDAVGLKWTNVPPDNNNALFISQNNVILGVSSYTGINFVSDGNDLVAISTNSENTKIVDVRISSRWNKDGNTGIYTSKFVGIGSTNPTVALDVIGNGKFSGIVTAGKFSGQSGIITGTVEVGSLVVSGISTFIGVTTFSKVGIGSTTIPRSTLDVGGDVWVSGAVTALSFTADNFYGTITTAKYAIDAGIATNLKGGVANNLPYQSGPSSTSFIANGTPGYYLKSNGSSLPPSWESLPVTTIDVDETQSTLTNYPLFVDATGSTSVLYINTSLFSFVPQISNPRLGIGTGSPAYNLDVNGKGRFIGTVGADIYYGNGFVGTALSISGIATVSNTFKVGTAITMNAGIITAITFVGNLTGTASTASYATTAFSLNGVSESNLNVAFATTATNVIGGIASVTSLFVNQTGISTLGTVKISSGIVTATTGIVTYYGDGSKLTGVSGVKVELQELTGNPVYPTLANSAGVSSIGIATTGNNSLVFIPSSGNLGIGTTSPTSKLWVNGDGYFVGVVTSAGFYVNGELIGQGGITGENIVGTALSISGISTLGTVKISSGIVTASSGIVTYYGDGSKLTGVSGVKVELQTLVGDPVYPTLANSTGVSSVGISTIGNTALVFIPSRGSLGIGTTLPLTTLQVEKYGVKTGFGTFVASAGITTDVDSFVISINDFKTAEYTVHIQSASSIQAQKVLVMQNGTNAFSQEYGIMYEPTFMVSIGATVSAGTCKLQFTPESGISGLMTYRFTRETMI